MKDEFEPKTCYSQRFFPLGSLWDKTAAIDRSEPSASLRDHLSKNKFCVVTSKGEITNYILMLELE